MKYNLPILLLSIILGSTLLSCKTYKDPKKDIQGYEAPKDYTVDELKKHYLAMGFDHQIEFEKLTIAKETVTNAQLNLLPHLGVSFAFNFIGVTTFNPIMLVKSIGTLAPFLFPNSWIKVSEKNHAYEAQKFALNIVDQDAIQLIDSYAYNYFRDKKLFQLINQHVDNVREISEQIKIKEEMGLLPTGTYDQFQTITTQNEQTKISAINVLIADLKAIALVAGFRNDDAIINVIEDTDSIDNAYNEELLTQEQFSLCSLESSLEIKQINELIEVAIQQSKERNWNWIDPSGDGSGLIGAGLPSYINIGLHNVDLVRTQKEKLVAHINAETKNLWNEINQNKASFDLLTNLRKTQLSRVEQAKTQIELGTLISPLDYYTLLQSQVQAELQYLNVKYTFLVNHSKYHRYLLDKQ